jgi:hypothetical protein
MAFAGAIAAALLGVACSGARAPRATIADARLRERGEDAAVVEFVIEAENPNDIELPIRDISYTLALDGRQVFSGKREALATIPRHGTQRVVIPVVVPMGENGVSPDLYRYSLRGRMRYSLPSQLADVLFDAKVSRPGVSIGEEGEIDLR